MATDPAPISTVTAAPLSPDPITAILVAVTEVRGMLVGAVDTMNRHDGELVELRRRSEDDRTKLASLQATVAGLPRRAVPPSAVWSVVGVAIAAVTVLASLLGHLIGG